MRSRFRRLNNVSESCSGFELRVGAVDPADLLCYVAVLAMRRSDQPGSDRSATDASVMLWGRGNSRDGMRAAARGSMGIERCRGIVRYLSPVLLPGLDQRTRLPVAVPCHACGGWFRGSVTVVVVGRPAARNSWKPAPIEKPARGQFPASHSRLRRRKGRSGMDASKKNTEVRSRVVKMCH
jgi:hypothetical protein